MGTLYNNYWRCVFHEKTHDKANGLTWNTEKTFIKATYSKVALFFMQISNG